MLLCYFFHSCFVNKDLVLPNAKCAVSIDPGKSFPVYVLAKFIPRMLRYNWSFLGMMGKSFDLSPFVKGAANMLHKPETRVFKLEQAQEALSLMVSLGITLIFFTFSFDCSIARVRRQNFTANGVNCRRQIFQNKIS
jgi:hypothetical protein